MDETAAYYFTLLLLSPIIVVGLLGNCLSILTWSRGSHKDTSTAVLLTGLGVVDTLVLCIPAAEFWTLEMYGFQLRSVHIIMCKTFPFLSYFAPAMSSWILVLVTAERFVSMWFPVTVRYVCTRVKVGVLLGILSVVLGLIYCPFMIITELQEKENTTTEVCDVSKNSTFEKHYYPIWMWLDLCCLFVVPFIFIVAGNLSILYKLFSSRNMFIKDGRATSFRRRTANSFTVRALALSIAFLVCLSPVAVQEVYRAHTGDKMSPLGYVLIHILLYGNSCINFILYCVIGTGFRQDMKSVCKKILYKVKYNGNSRHPSASTYYPTQTNTTTQLDYV